MSYRKRYFLMFSIMLLIFSAGCQANMNPLSREKYRVSVVNSSKVPVYKITYDMKSQSGGGMNADGSKLRQGDSIDFDFQEISEKAVWSVLDEDDNIIASETLSMDFDERNDMIIHIESAKDSLKLMVLKP